MSKNPNLPTELIKFASECELIVAELENLYVGIKLLAPFRGWLKDVRTSISDMSILLQNFNDADSWSDVCAELEEHYTALDDTLSGHPDGYRIQGDVSVRNDDLDQLLHRTSERAKEIAYSFNERVLDAHFW